MSRASNLIVKPLKNNRRGRKVNDTPERMIRRFTRKVKKAGILNEVRRRRYHRKPSEVRNERNNRIKREKAKNKNLRNKKN
jgi:ribosomal protein S21